MIKHFSIVVSLVLGVTLSPVLRAAPPPAVAQTEINYLLGFIEGSGCEFYRNGSWYDSKRAQAHLRDKFNTLAGMGRIGSAEDFVEKAATKSYLSGRAYMVRCAGTPAVSSNRYLLELLAQFRKCAVSNAQCAPRITRGALGSKLPGSN